MSSPAARMPLIDAMRAIASQLIVLHHLAFYGPMSDAALELAPGLIHWLSEHARIAVQAFLVAGGFLSARGLAPRGVPVFGQPGPLLVRRYLRLAAPLLAALALAIAASALARALNPHDSIPDAPQPAQLLSHVFLLQDVLDQDALSAGVWYVAIDFQLFALMLAGLWAVRALARWSRRWTAAGDAGSVPQPPPAAGPSAAAPLATAPQAAATLRAGDTPPGLAIGLVATLGLASLFGFNRDPDWDAWAPYFFGAYALGACAWWAGSRNAPPWWLAAIALAGLAALAFDFRPRIALALVVALGLGIARRGRWLERWPNSAALAWLGGISYSVFLVHFPICLVIGALFWRLAPGNPAVNALGMAVAWAASVAAGALFHRTVEQRFTGSGRAASGYAGRASGGPGSGTGSRANRRSAAPGAADGGSPPRP